MSPVYALLPPGHAVLLDAGEVELRREPAADAEIRPEIALAREGERCRAVPLEEYFEVFN